MSLDFEEAFDIVGRDHVFKALELFDLFPDLRHFINLRLLPHDYCLFHKDLVGRFRVHRGFKQGACDAPLLGIVCMGHFLHQLLAAHPIEWIRQYVVILLMTFIFVGLWIPRTRHKKLSMTSSTWFDDCRLLDFV